MALGLDRETENEVKDIDKQIVDRRDRIRALKRERQRFREQFRRGPHVPADEMEMGKISSDIGRLEREIQELKRDRQRILEGEGEDSG